MLRFCLDAGVYLMTPKRRAALVASIRLRYADCRSFLKWARIKSRTQKKHNEHMRRIMRAVQRHRKAIAKTRRELARHVEL